ncbi:MAG: hypothetical protein BIFFINMI_03493 [Phycisphaerae bacterium]|nr:hypothetical protein [Phycisphaerae bacterium]
MRILRWAVVPLIFAAICLAVWFGWGLFDRRHGLPARDRIYYDPDSRLWVRFGPDGVGPTADAPRPQPPDAVATIVDRFCFAIYPTSEGLTAARRGDPLAPRVEVWHAALPSTQPDGSNLADALLGAIEQAYGTPTPLRPAQSADAGLGGTRADFRLQVSRNGVPTELRVGLLARGGQAWIVWAATPIGSPQRSDLDEIVASFRFVAPPSQ